MTVKVMMSSNQHTHDDVSDYISNIEKIQNNYVSRKPLPTLHNCNWLQTQVILGSYSCVRKVALCLLKIVPAVKYCMK